VGKGRHGQGVVGQQTNVWNSFGPRDRRQHTSSVMQATLGEGTDRGRQGKRVIRWLRRGARGLGVRVRTAAVAMVVVMLVPGVVT